LTRTHPRRTHRGVVTNAVSVRLFWGGNDGGSLSTAWAVSEQATGTLTNGQSYSLASTYSVSTQSVI
jgi:hypothetical protein